jgi:cytochrome c
MKSLISFTATLAFAISTSLAYAQDATKGEVVFRLCIACHSIGENARNKTGPQLNGLFGRKAGSVEGYAYSPAMQNSGIVWNNENFTSFIKDPHSFMPLTKMAFVGLNDEANIKDLIAYLKKFNSDGKKN